MLILTNRKGGAGKTALAVNIAASYAESQRVLLIDCDAQGDASAGLGVDDTGEALADALMGRGSLEQAIQETEWGVDVAPAGEALAYVADMVSPDAVAKLLEAARTAGYRWVIADCPPSLSSFVFSVWQADREAIALVPVDGVKAFRATHRLRRAWEDAALDPRKIRIVINRYDGRRVLDREVDRQARETYGEAVLTTRVRDSVVIGESDAWRRPLLAHAATHPATDDFRRIAWEVAHG